MVRASVRRLAAGLKEIRVRAPVPAISGKVMVMPRPNICEVAAPTAITTVRAMPRCSARMLSMPPGS